MKSLICLSILCLGLSSGEPVGLPGRLGDLLSLEDEPAEVSQPEVLRSRDEILALARRLYEPSWREGMETTKFSGRAGVGGCDEIGQSRLVASLRKYPGELPEVEDLLTRVAVSESHRYTNSSSGCRGEHFEITADRPLEATDLEKLSRTLETAWCTLCGSGTFDCPTRAFRVHVHDMYPGVWGSTAPGMPIHLNRREIESVAALGSQAEKSWLLAQVAHELFHKIQYEYGFRRDWGFDENRDPAWATEGLASWAETYVMRTEYADYEPFGGTPGNRWAFWKYELAASKPSVSLWDRDYDALPFWLYLERRALEIEPGRGWQHRLDGQAEHVAAFMTKVSGGSRLEDALEEWEPDYLDYAVGQARDALQLSGNSPASRPTLLDSGRAYLRPYTVRLSCEGGGKRQWRHRGTVTEMTAAYFRLVNESGAAEQVLIQVEPDEPGSIGWELGPSAAGTDVTVVGPQPPPRATAPPNGRPRPRRVASYDLTATLDCGGSGS